MAYVITQQLVSGMADKGLTTSENIDDVLLGKTQEEINQENRKMLLTSEMYEELKASDLLEDIMYLCYDDDDEWGFGDEFDIIFD